MFNKKILIVLIVAAMLMTVSCAPMGGDELVLADAGWDSIQIHNGIASFIIENGYGYETRVPVRFHGHDIYLPAGRQHRHLYGNLAGEP